MKAVVIVLICALMSACSKSQSNFIAESPSLSCDSLNQKYVGFTKEQLLSQSAEYSNAAAAVEGEYYINLYNSKSIEFLKASECK